MFGFLSSLEFSGAKSIVVLCAVVAVAVFDVIRRSTHRPTHLLFAVILGSVLSLGLICTADILLQPGSEGNPIAAAAGFMLAVLCWRALFGQWDVQTKATMLGTFLFWISLHIVGNDAEGQVSVRLIAAAVALLPAVIWCLLFLKYHRERFASVILLFLAGMLSTAPILFYDLLVRRGIELQFFFFRIQPESFSQVSHTLVSQLQLESANGSMLMVTMLSFVFVALIEEVSKYWVLSRSGKQLFSSIDDVMQLSIIAAIGFAFAENIINPVYFTAFVREYLLHTVAPDIGAFVSNVLGRSVLTSMVHIVSTGVMGYFLGLAIFAGPYIAERRTHGKVFLIIAALHRLLRLPEMSVFRIQMLVMGLLSAVGLHALFNFLVTLPEILPGNPQSIADIIGPSAPAFLTYVPFLLLPALFYVVGGFWLLTTLFMRKTNLQERGHLVMQEEFVA